MKLNFATGIVCLGMALHFVASASQAVLIYSTDDDRSLRPNARSTGSPARLGFTSSAASGGRNVVYTFKLPTPDGPIASASFSFVIAEDLTDGDYSIDLYGLGLRTSSTTAATTDYYAGPSDGTDAWLLSNDIIGSANTFTGRLQTGDDANDALKAYLTAQYASWSTSTENWIVLRLSPDVTTSAVGDSGVSVNLGSAGGDFRAALDITFVPEPGVSLGLACVSVLTMLRGRHGRS